MPHGHTEDINVDLQNFQRIPRNLFYMECTNVYTSLFPVKLHLKLMLMLWMLQRTKILQSVCNTLLLALKTNTRARDEIRSSSLWLKLQQGVMKCNNGYIVL